MLHFTCLKSQILKNRRKVRSVTLGHKHPKHTYILGMCGSMVKMIKMKLKHNWSYMVLFRMYFSKKIKLFVQNKYLVVHCVKVATVY